VTNDTYSFVTSLLKEVRVRSSPSFSGLGLILYAPPMRLPVVSLGDQSLFQPQLPVREIETIAEVLARISTLESPWHDGFHLIDARAAEMTHVSQFFSPPLDRAQSLRVSAMPIGARQMSAMLGSMLPIVECTALLTKRGDSLVFRAGAAV
jgi:hypothetical protein